MRNLVKRLSRSATPSAVFPRAFVTVMSAVHAGSFIGFLFAHRCLFFHRNVDLLLPHHLPLTQVTSTALCRRLKTRIVQWPFTFTHTTSLDQLKETRNSSDGRNKKIYRYLRNAVCILQIFLLAINNIIISNIAECFRGNEIEIKMN